MSPGSIVSTPSDNRLILITCIVDLELFKLHLKHHSVFKNVDDFLCRPTDPVEPLWPFTEWVPQVNLFPADPLLWNLGFLGFGVAACVGAYRNDPR